MTLHQEEAGASQLLLSSLILLTLFPTVLFDGVFVGSGSANLIHYSFLNYFIYNCYFLILKHYQHLPVDSAK